MLNYALLCCHNTVIIIVNGRLFKYHLNYIILLQYVGKYNADRSVDFEVSI